MPSHALEQTEKVRKYGNAVRVIKLAHTDIEEEK